MATDLPTPRPERTQGGILCCAREEPSPGYPADTGMHPAGPAPPPVPTGVPRGRPSPPPPPGEWLTDQAGHTAGIPGVAPDVSGARHAPSLAGIPAPMPVAVAATSRSATDGPSGLPHMSPPSMTTAPTAETVPWTHYASRRAEEPPSAPSPPPLQGERAIFPGPCTAPNVDPEWVVAMKNGTQCCEFAAAPEMPAQHLCNSVAAWLGVADARLVHGGQQVEGTETLLVFGVQRHSVLHAHPCLRGGGTGDAASAAGVGDSTVRGRRTGGGRA